jgi:hypothetical protein
LQSLRPEFANWLASYPKSGNTWVRLFLNAYVIGALDINCNAGVTLYDCDEYTSHSLSPHTLKDMPPETSIYLRPAVLLHLLYARKYAPTIIKTHSANVVIGGITMIPRPLTRKAVYLVRDPRDVCASFSKHLDITVDEAVAKMANPDTVLYRDGLGTWITDWSNHVKTWQRDFVTTIRYEDLKADPEKYFQIILETFGITPNAKKIRKAIRLCDIGRLKKQEAKSGFIEKGKSDLFFGQGKGWKNELTEKQARRVEEDHGTEMELLGY